jgi:hypothetical protein
VVSTLSTPDTATGSRRSGDARALPLSSNSSSVPAPDEEKYSLIGGLKPNEGVNAELTAPTVIA